MSAVERYDGGAPAWVAMLAPVAELARSIADTDFVPDALRRKPAAIAACVMYGAELGVGPMTALAKIHIVKGRPAPSAELGRALVIAAGHTMWIETATTTRATMCGQRRGDEHVHTVTWTLDDAKRAGIAGSATWRAYPRQMLVARASTELIRQAFPDVLGGITVFAEELDDAAAPVVALSPPVDGAAPPATTKRQRPQRPAPAPTAATTTTVPATPDFDVTAPMPELPAHRWPEPELPLDDDHELAAEERMITPPQTRAMHAAMREAELNDRSDRLAFSTAVVGRPIGSSKDLTRDEASRVIDAAKAITAGTLAITVSDDGWTLHDWESGEGET